MLLALSVLPGCRSYADLEKELAQATVLMILRVDGGSWDVPGTATVGPPHRARRPGEDPFGLVGADRTMHEQTNCDVIAIVLGDDPVTFEDLVARTRADGNDFVVEVEAPLGKSPRWVRHLSPVSSPEAASALASYVADHKGSGALGSGVDNLTCLSVRIPGHGTLRTRIELTAPELRTHLREWSSSARKVVRSDEQLVPWPETPTPREAELALAREVFHVRGNPSLRWEIRCARRAD